MVPRPFDRRVAITNGITNGTISSPSSSSTSSSQTSSSSPISSSSSSSSSSIVSSSLASTITPISSSTPTNVYSTLNSSAVDEEALSTAPSSNSSATITPLATRTTSRYCSIPSDIDAATYCRVSVGTVQLHFWPTGTATLNHTYPKTTVLSEFGLTMTSPLIYYVINTMIATDYCGNTVGPTFKNYITSYNITDVSTLQPYANAKATTRMGNPEQLHLSDLKSNCPQAYTAPAQNHNIWNTRDPGCNPVLVWRTDLKDAGGPAWDVCGRRYGGHLGIFDPSSPVDPCNGNDCGDQGAESVTSSTPLPTTAIQDQQASTSQSPAAQPSPTLSSGPAQTSTPASTQVAAQSTPASGNRGSTAVISIPVPSNPAASNSILTLASTPTTPVIIATLGGSNTISAAPGASSVLIGSQAISVGGTPVTISGQGVVTLASSGLVVSSSNGGVATYAIPQNSLSPSLSPIVTLSGGGVISASAGASSIVYGSQTASIGGPAITVSGQGVVSLSPSGLVVSSANGGIATYALPQNSPSSSSSPIVTLPGGGIISAAAGASSVVYGSQTASVGGPAITVSGQGVVSLSPSGLVVSNSVNGLVSTYALPSPTFAQSIAVVGGQTISGLAIGSSVAIIAGQTVSIDGSVATISGNQVISLGPSGVVVQLPGGGVTTISVPTPTASPTSSPIQNPAVTKNLSGTNLAGALVSTAPTASGTSASLGKIIQSMSSSGHAAVGTGFLCWLGSAVLGAIYLL
ncbi:hypothetical protein G7Y89_g2681 [Cudoniella acicularis]|uniref:Uncharacterized protein n=1 Tax=Cudoniella acicularis TaxID=354080 RepID=A0A8H4RU11_9HELO|nr:hypothetical protein G7Y89_g2681 [Cudoniella acicularis]